MRRQYYQSIDVSVVIPFFNTAANIEDCLASMVSQTLDPQRFEVVLVDDGSTDGTPERVAGWARRHPSLISVHRIAATGWPGTPRNVGIELARGRYVQFVDSDDSLAPRALERILEVADSSDADVVVSKLSSDFRGVHHALFRQTVTHRTLADYPLAQNLTVCKAFRRDFLLAHDIRFAAGPRHVEDQHICVQAFVHATSVAVIGDTACYFYRRRRTSGRNLGDTVMVPSEYYRDLGYVLDVSDQADIAPVARAGVQRRIYRTEMLGRLRGGAMLGYDAGYRNEMVVEVRELATKRIPAEVRDGLPMLLRVQSRLLVNDDVDGLLAHAQLLDRITLRAVARRASWRDGKLDVELDAYLALDDEPFALERVGDGWALPAALAPGAEPTDRLLRSDAEEDLDLDLATLSRADGQSWSTTSGMRLEIDSGGCPRIHGSVALDPSTVMGGDALTAGRWDLRLRVTFAGLQRGAPLLPGTDTMPPPGSWVAGSDDDPQAATAYWNDPARRLTLDIDEWAHWLHDEVASAPDATPQLNGRRELVVPAGRLRGPTGTTRRGRLVLTPVDSPTTRAVSCDAELQLSPDGSIVRAAVPALPSGADRWALWLAIGEVGGAPPSRLGGDLRPGRLGRLSLSTPTES